MAENKFLQLPPLRIRRVVVATLTIAAVVAGFWLLLQWYGVVFILFVALVISTAIKPVVDRMHKRGVPRPVGVAIVYAVIFATLGVAVVLGAPRLAEQSARIAGALPGLYRNLREAMLKLPNLLIWRLALALPDELPLLTAQEATDSETVNAFNQAWQYLGIAGQSLFSITATLLLAFYWTIEGSRLKQAMLFLLPVERRDAGRELVADVEAKLGQYVVGQALLMLVVGAMSFVAYLLIRLPYALVLAIIAGILEAVPLIGPGLGAIPAALVAYADEPTKVIWVLVATLVIQQIENNLLVPRIMSRTVGVNPLVTLLAFIALGSLFGIAGAIAAIPIAAVAQLLLNRFLLNPDATTEAKPGGRDRFSVLRYEAQELVRDVRKQAQTNAAGQDDEEHSLEDSLEAIATKLDELLAENGTREAER